MSLHQLAALAIRDPILSPVLFVHVGDLYNPFFKFIDLLVSQEQYLTSTNAPLAQCF